ncbi:MAG: hypothetical protein ACI4EU_08595 [Butyrivibrio sp.]
MDETRQLTVDGYVFENMQDYEDALKEKEGIKYLNRQIDLNDSAKTYAVYKEILDKKIFRTPVGIQYMNRLRQSLIQSGMSDVPCIPVSRATEKKAGDRELKKLSEKYKKKKEHLRTSLIFNIVLAIMIVAMFIISATSNNPTIINYREKIEDRYSQWDTQLKDKEKELREREKAIEQKEHELGITENNNGSQN